MVLEKDLEKAAELLAKAVYAIGLTGAGVSVESGIRPYRGPDGVWTERGEPPMDGYLRFLADPRGSWEKWNKREGFPPGFLENLMNARPNAGHCALAELENMGRLKFLITQNVDNLHRAAGTRQLGEIHGNIKLVRCIQCNSRSPMEDTSLEILPPICSQCGGLIKIDGVLFGEPIPRDVLQKCQEEVDKCDCLLSVGTSAVVYPAGGFPLLVKKRGGVLIEVDPSETELTGICEISLRGKSGEVLPLLVEKVKVFA
jgi:NAD-dependent deacetylase